MQRFVGKWVRGAVQITKNRRGKGFRNIINKNNNNNSSSSSPIYPFIPIYPYVAGVSAWVRGLPIAYPFTHKLKAAK